MMGYGRGVYGYGYDHMVGGSWVGGLGMLFFGALVVLGIVLLVVWAARASRGHATAGGHVAPAPAARPDEAVTIARTRLASGEITSEQYAEIMKALGG